MENSSERKMTSLKVSVDEKTQLMRYFGTTVFSKIVRKLLNGKPVLLDKELKELIEQSGFKDFGIHYKLQDCLKQMAYHSMRNNFIYRDNKKVLDELERRVEHVDFKNLFKKR